MAFGYGLIGGSHTFIGNYYTFDKNTYGFVSVFELFIGVYCIHVHPGVEKLRRHTEL